MTKTIEMMSSTGDWASDISRGALYAKMLIADLHASENPLPLVSALRSLAAQPWGGAQVGFAFEIAVSAAGLRLADATAVPFSEPGNGNDLDLADPTLPACEGRPVSATGQI